MISVKWNLQAGARWRFRWLWSIHGHVATLDLGRVWVRFPWLTADRWH